MQTLPLILRDGHLFAELDGKLWLYDTGAPTSFGDTKNLAFGGARFTLDSSYMGLSAATLSRLTGVQCAGLLGADILGGFDHVLDLAEGTLEVSTTELEHAGQSLPLDQFMGVPILTVQIVGTNYRMFFDTGAQVSYFQDDTLAGFPATGRITDFYPGVGQFQTDIHEVLATLGDSSFCLQFGRLPDLLSLTLMLSGTQGIVGNEVLTNRRVGYFPRRSELRL